MPGEILEKRQLLSDDPITEMNSQWNLGIGTSNAQIDAFFNSGSTGAAGGLNGALGGAAAKFNQLPLNGSEIEDSAIQDVSTKFGTVESRVNTSMNLIKSSKPLIGFPESFGIGTPYPMPMPGMQIGNRGYSYVNMFTGDFYGTSNFIVEVPSSTPGVLTSRLELQGTISRSSGVVTSNLRGDYMKNEPGLNVVYHVEIVNPGSSSGNILKFNASQTIGEITTNASADIVDGVTNYYSFGGSGNFGDITASFSKSKMYQTERLFGQIEYLSGNTKASAQLTQITSPNANYTAAKGLLSYMEGQPGAEKYLRVGVGNVTGTVSGQSINESFGGIALGMPVKRPWWLPFAPGYIVVQQGWHNSDNWGAPPALMSSPPAMNQGTLFLGHESMKSSIWNNVDQFTGQFIWSY